MAPVGVAVSLMTRSSIRLRPFAREDFPAILRWIDTPELLLQWAGRNFVWPLDEPQLESYLQSSHGDSPQRRLYSAVNGVDGSLVGHIGLRDICHIHRGAMVSCVLVGEAASRGRGIGSAMMKEICEIGFSHLGLHRLDLYVFDFNQGARRCYERAGFRTEGLLREKFRHGDVFWSCYLMSQLRPEWEERRGIRLEVGDQASGPMAAFD
jgi:RimJ/RimL family protein N-acetyltransferase